MRRKSLRIVLAVLAVILVALVVLWSQRKPLAHKIIEDAFKEKGVKGTFAIRELDHRRQRIEHLVIGDSAHPDLVADWVELDSSLGFSGFSVKTVRASGVRLNGRLVDGKLSFGTFDKLLPKPTGEPFTLPDLDIDVRDGRLALATPWGSVGAVLTGKGNLADGFAGAFNLAAPRLATSTCHADGIAVAGRFEITSSRPHFTGPVQVARADCGTVQAREAELALDASLSEDFARWQGRSGIRLAALSARGTSLKATAGFAEFEGSSAQTSLRTSLSSAAITSALGASAGRTSFSGSFVFGAATGGSFGAKGDGDIRVADLRPDQLLIKRLLAPALSGERSPLGGLVSSLTTAVRGLERGGDARARIALDLKGARGAIAFSEISGISRSGARFAVQGDAPVTINWPGGVQLDGVAQLQGGGFPATRVQLAGDGGVANIAPIMAGGTRLALAPVRFRLAPRWRVETIATLDGKLGTGQVRGLTLPVSLAAGGTPLAGCNPVRFESIRFNALALAPGAINLCLRGNQAHVAGLMLSGRLGDSPLALSATSATLALGNADFGLDGLKVRIGAGAESSEFIISKLSGTMSGGNALGTYGGIAARIGTVPLRITEANGHWKFSGGNLAATGSFLLADAADEARFQPMGVTGFDLGLSNGRIVASATVNHTQTGTPVANVRLSHMLSNGAGEALIDVPGITFGQQVQPEELTRVTLGVIANVQGTLKGDGRIAWSPNGVTSTGRFGTEGVDLAAAFGPVTRLQGFVEFTDLLGLVSAPGQTVRIAQINPGIAVTEGEIRFQLLPNLRTGIEGGRWPFAGGELLLDPTVLDLSEQAERHLTFRVVGLDAARFLQQLEFENVSATGTFSGVLPMIFDKDGGRIVGGRIDALGGGTVSYVGDISNEKLGAMGRFAFDALKSIRYERLSINLDGALDGDVVTRVSFKGINQAPIGGVRAKLPIPIKVTGLTGIPFIFNVTITAPFRQLFEMSRSFNDPSRVIQRFQPRLQPVPPQPAGPQPVNGRQPPVKPAASERVQ